MTRVKIGILASFLMLVSTASAVPDGNSSSLTWLLYNVSLIVTSVTTMFTNIMVVFMQPPLVLFVGMGIFGVVIGIIGKYMKGRRK